jgi:hypothetical protein
MSLACSVIDATLLLLLLLLLLPGATTSCGKSGSCTTPEVTL